MPHQNTIFNQLFNFIPRHRFDRAVTGLRMDRYSKGFSAWKQFLTLLYAQISSKESLREMESGLTTHQNKLYHLGLAPVPKSTLADAMARRAPAIFEEIFYEILSRAQALAPKHKFSNPLYTIDSTTIDLCLSMYDWARFRRQKGAIKLHCQLDHRSNLPAFLVMTDGKTADVTAAERHFRVQPDSIYCVDPAYMSLAWLGQVNDSGAYFVTRLKNNADIHIIGQHARPGPGVLQDSVIEFCNPASYSKYPHKMRAIEFYDEDNEKTFVFITNNFRLPSATIAEIYRQRWQIELFFKWIKQNLKLKTFLGTSRNAVMTQVWVAMIYYLLVSYIKFISRLALSITEITRRIRDGLMSRLSLVELLAISSLSDFGSGTVRLYQPYAFRRQGLMFSTVGRLGIYCRFWCQSSTHWIEALYCMYYEHTLRER